MVGPTQLIIKYFSPIVWYISSKKKIQAIKKFGMVEKDSAIQLLQCCYFFEDPLVRAALFDHVIEEIHHHEMFEDLATQLSDVQLVDEVLQRDETLSRNPTKTNLIEAYAYAHVGEFLVSRDFVFYAKGRFEQKIRVVFAKVAADERRHSLGTDEILMLLTKNDRGLYRWLVFKSFIKLKCEKYLSYLRSFGDLQLNLVLGFIYFLSGLILKEVFKDRIALSAENQFQLFFDQIKDFERQFR